MHNRVDSDNGIRYLSADDIRAKLERERQIAAIEEFNREQKRINRNRKKRGKSPKSPLAIAQKLPVRDAIDPAYLEVLSSASLRNKPHEETLPHGEYVKYERKWINLRKWENSMQPETPSKRKSKRTKFSTRKTNYAYGHRNRENEWIRSERGA